MEYIGGGGGGYQLQLITCSHTCDAHLKGWSRVAGSPYLTFTSMPPWPHILDLAQLPRNLLKFRPPGEPRACMNITVYLESQKCLPDAHLALTYLTCLTFPSPVQTWAKGWISSSISFIIVTDAKLCVVFFLSYVSHHYRLSVIGAMIGGLYFFFSFLFSLELFPVLYERL